MTIEEIKAYLEKKIEERRSTKTKLQSDIDGAESYGYAVALGLLKNWNGK